NAVNRLRDGAVLKHGLGEVNYVVDDDFRAACRKGKNVRPERSLAAERRCERKIRTGSDVVNNLEYGSAFVGSTRADRNLLNDRPRWQVAASGIRGGAAEAIEAI